MAYFTSYYCGGYSVEYSVYWNCVTYSIHGISTTHRAIVGYLKAGLMPIIPHGYVRKTRCTLMLC